MLAERLQRDLAGGAFRGFSSRFSSPAPALALLCRVLQQLGFQWHHLSMHLLFDVHTRGFRVGLTPLFHITHDLCARAQPGVLFHVFFFPLF